MGEGLNDVPALKKANVAIVVQEASDIARAVSDIVLLKQDLHVVVAGIRQGRITFSNINKYIQCTLAGNFGNYYSLALFSLIVPFLPMLPTQILLINLLSDFPLIAIASDSVDSYQVRRPQSYSLIKMLPLMLLLGFVGTLSDIMFFSVFYNTSPDMFRSLWFVLNILSDMVLIFSIRSSKFFLHATRPSLLLVLASCISAFICLILPYSKLGHSWFTFVDPTAIDMAKVCGIVLVYGIMIEFVKLQYYKYMMKLNNH
jgi:Mg2+-importing ATPase